MRKLTDQNRLSLTLPHIIQEWHHDKNTLSPSEVSNGSGKKAWWKCQHGHSYKARIVDRKRGRGCPYCSSQKICIDNSLATLSPHVAKEWDYEKNDATPFKVMPRSNKKAHWICSRGHRWESVINSRHNSGCPICSQIELRDGEICDSMVEAYLYLKYRQEELNFSHGGIYRGQMGKRKYDFFFPKGNKYVEVTGFRKDSQHNHFSYLRNIVTECSRRKPLDSSMEMNPSCFPHLDNIIHNLEPISSFFKKRRGNYIFLCTIYLGL